jgi:hypothetical protein
MCIKFGYNREGRNANYRPIDFNLSVDIEKYTVIFILEQYSD